MVTRTPSRHRSTRNWRARIAAAILAVTAGLSGLGLGAGPAHASGIPGAVGLYRYYNPTAATHWVTTNLGEISRSYSLEGRLGYLLNAPDPYGHSSQLFDCVVPGTVDHFLSLDARCEGQQVLGSAGYSYTVRPATSYPVVELYRCYLWRGSHGDHFVSTDPHCEGQITEGPLGYALTTRASIADIYLGVYYGRDPKFNGIS